VRALSMRAVRCCVHFGGGAQGSPGLISRSTGGLWLIQPAHSNSCRAADRLPTNVALADGRRKRDSRLGHLSRMQQMANSWQRLVASLGRTRTAGLGGKLPFSFRAEEEHIQRSWARTPSRIVGAVCRTPKSALSGESSTQQRSRQTKIASGRASPRLSVLLDSRTRFCAVTAKNVSTMTLRFAQEHG
jgi:hypothetical protein